MNNETQLLSLCYKEVRPKVWVKPVGASLFTYEENNTEWTNWFKGADEKIHIWNFAIFEEDVRDKSDKRELKDWLVFQETWTRINVGIGGDFSILKLEEF